jgi:precorrin-6Y C5,15-methyltransferase (decarboxylating)
MGRAAAMADWTPGIPEDEFHYRQPKRGLITKTEVRVLSLAKLRLREDSVVWDIGAASGSVAIEAALIARHGRVYAVEKNAEDMDLLRENIGKFGVGHVTAVNARAPEKLDDLPDPDAVFIGGSGGEMRELLEIVWKRLRPGGRVVVNAITLDNSHEAVSGMKEMGFEVEALLVQIARSRPLLGMTSFEALNPVYIITGKRPGE